MSSERHCLPNLHMKPNDDRSTFIVGYRIHKNAEILDPVYSARISTVNRRQLPFGVDVSIDIAFPLWEI